MQVKKQCKQCGRKYDVGITNQLCSMSCYKLLMQKARNFWREVSKER